MGQNFKKVISLVLCLLVPLSGRESWGMSPDIGMRLPAGQFGELLTLEEALERSLHGHFGMKGAVARFRKERAILYARRAEFFPKLHAEYYGAFSSNGLKPVGYADLVLEQPLFQGGKSVQEVKRQKARLQINKQKINESRFDIELEIRLIYIQLLREKELIRLAQNQEREISVEKKKFKELVQGGFFAAPKLMHIKTLYEKAKVELVKHKENYDYLVFILKDMTGLTDKETLEIEPRDETLEFSEDVQFYIDRARENDPMYRIKSLEIKEKEFEKKSLEANRWPTLSLTVKGNVLKDEYVDTRRVLAGVEGKWNIFDFGRLGGEIKAKQYETEEIEWEGKLEVQKKERMIRELFHEAKTLKEMVRLRLMEEKEAGAIYKNKRIRIIAGEEAMSSLVDSYIALQEKRMAKIDAVSQLQITLLYLDRASGGFGVSGPKGEVD
ncbi:MAG: TolC family protein [Candidatus Omnitrophica bacterium]|nr:TolC family protein [Candidatus Omnitrophota bacterium]